jgi:hypothetical protein
MANPGRKFIGALRRWGAESAENKAELVKWKTEALREIAENKGGHMVSGSGNGVAFTQHASMTNAEWFAALDEALEWIDKAIAPPSRTHTRIL